MLERYFRLKEYLDHSDSDLIPLLPSPRQENCLRELISDLTAFDSICKKLQATNTTLADVRIFDSLLFSAKYPEISHYLQNNAITRLRKCHCCFIAGKRLSEEQTTLLLKFRFSAVSSLQSSIVGTGDDSKHLGRAQ